MKTKQEKPHEVKYSEVVLKAVEEGRKLLKGEKID